MKSFLLFIALLCAVTLSSTMTPSSSKAANAAKKQRSTVTFTQPVMLKGVALKGEYLFVHDDAAMLRGETCTFVYEGTAENPSKLVASFHCTPAERPRVSSFAVRMMLSPTGQNELTEFQFGGSTEGHVVPVR